MYSYVNLIFQIEKYCLESIYKRFNLYSIKSYFYIYIMLYNGNMF